MKILGVPIHLLCAQGVMNGSIMAMLSLWAPPLERSTLSTFIYTGTSHRRNVCLSVRPSVCHCVKTTQAGRETDDVSGKTMAIFSIFADYFSDTLEMRPALLYGDMQSVVGFSIIPKCMTLNDLDWLFRVKLCFRAALSG